MGQDRPRVRCVGALVHDDAGRLLVILRARPPSAGTWSVPGGRVEAGETDAQAVAREVREETGLDVTVGERVGSVERSGPAGVVYDIHDYACVADPGSLRPGTDAADARWVTAEDLRSLTLAPGLLDALDMWGKLPASRRTT